MRIGQFGAGVVVGAMLVSAPVYALRISRPPEFYKWDNNTFTALNDTLLQVYNVINGRYQSDFITTNPNGSRKCNKGESVMATFSGSDHICGCTTTGTTWKCAVIL